MGDDRLFATSHFVGPDSDLWQFSDAVMHWDCYAEWEHRARFGRMYFEAKQASSGRNPFWGVAHSDDEVLVTANPDKLVGEVDVMLAETGSRFRIPLADWEDWLGGGVIWNPCSSTRSFLAAVAAGGWFGTPKPCTARLP